ncbi:hypothetical protein EYE40_08680 [Glaciihabitans arcticus]|uniref:Uncharacterized protein n=1 Tax=Glaciihabitans arcticus TaxID=2668039 RepID=A0A4Q9GW74_9MICO|nr:hypothetical protein [Glaciihabitans arcticus]TBN57457.1 hypothetical protein EYE40_08680 [Glaciihabitans arcticus]
MSDNASHNDRPHPFKDSPLIHAADPKLVEVWRLARNNAGYSVDVQCRNCVHPQGLDVQCAAHVRMSYGYRYAAGDWTNVADLIVIANAAMAEAIDAGYLPNIPILFEQKGDNIRVRINPTRRRISQGDLDMVRDAANKALAPFQMWHSKRGANFRYAISAPPAADVPTKMAPFTELLTADKIREYKERFTTFRMSDNDLGWSHLTAWWEWSIYT